MGCTSSRGQDGGVILIVYDDVEATVRDCHDLVSREMTSSRGFRCCIRHPHLEREPLVVVDFQRRKIIKRRGDKLNEVVRPPVLVGVPTELLSSELPTKENAEVVPVDI